MKNRIMLIVAISILLIFARLALSPIILHFVQKKLNEIPEYKATVESVSINLYRGSYQINKVKLIKVNTKLPVPFFAANSIEFTVEWNVLFHGHLVAEVKATDPVLNFVIDPKGKNEQLTINDQWRTIVTKLFPLPFNKITLLNGEIYFKSYNSKPPFELYIKNISAELNNMRQITGDQNKLFAYLNAKGTAMDNADTKLMMQLNPFIEQPTFLLKGWLTNMNIKETNNFLSHYTKIKVSRGLFSLYVEAAAEKNKIKGYAKPIFKNLKIATPDSKNTNPIESLYNGAVQLIAKILENPKQKTVATKIMISGNINNPDTSLFSIIGYLLRHAFIQALLPGIDNSIKMQNVIYGAQE